MAFLGPFNAAFPNPGFVELGHAFNRSVQVVTYSTTTAIITGGVAVRILSIFTVAQQALRLTSAFVSVFSWFTGYVQRPLARFLRHIGVSRFSRYVLTCYSLSFGFRYQTFTVVGRCVSLP